MFTEIFESVFLAAVEQAWCELPAHEPAFTSLMEFDCWRNQVPSDQLSLEELAQLF